MASPHSFHERPGPVSDTVRSLFFFRPPPPPSSGLRPPPLAYALCPLAVSLDSTVNIAS